MAELVDALVSGTSDESRGGSSPLQGTNHLDTHIYMGFSHFCGGIGFGGVMDRLYLDMQSLADRGRSHVEKLLGFVFQCAFRKARAINSVSLMPR